MYSSVSFVAKPNIHTLVTCNWIASILIIGHLVFFCFQCFVYAHSDIASDCSSIAVITPQVSASKPYFPLGVSDPQRIVSLTIFWISTYAFVVIPPITSTKPVVVACLACFTAHRILLKQCVRIASEIASHILSGCPFCYRLGCK